MILFYLYLIVCAITWPIRVLMPFYSNFQFATHLVFGFKWKRSFVYNQSRFETRDFESVAVTTYKNYWNIGKSKNSRFQSTGSWDSKKVGEPIFSSYKTVYHCVWDYRDLITNRKRHINNSATTAYQYFWDSMIPVGSGYKDFSNENFPSDLKTNTQLVAQYVAGASELLHYTGFYTATPSHYADGVISFYYESFNGVRVRAGYSPSNWRFGVNTLFTVLLYYFAFRFIFRSRKDTSKAKNGNYSNPSRESMGRGVWRRLTSPRTPRIYSK